MLAATNQHLTERLNVLAIEARSFLGESTVMPNFLDVVFENYMTMALVSGPGPARDAWIERATGIRLMVDLLNEQKTQVAQRQVF